MIIEGSYVGREIGNYRIVTELARGAFGSVYTGKHSIFKDRPFVAIKLLHTHLGSQEERDRFFQEAQLLEMLKHPYILPIIDAGINNGFPYLVVEYAPGGSLRDRLQSQSQSQHPFEIEEALTILSQIGQALQYAHRQNIIHRDLKPENILFNTKGEAILADFGIATVLATAKVKQATIIGTPTYMAPEQFQGIISWESDQYALGCIAYELTTLSKPFTAPDFVALMFKHVMEKPVAPKQLNPQLPEHIERAILKAMAKERTNRHADISVFISILHGNKEQWVDEGNDHYKADRYEQALAAYEQALLLDPKYITAYYYKGQALDRLGKSERALAAYKQVLLLESMDADAYYYRGRTFQRLWKLEEALEALEQAIQLDPKYAYAYSAKGNVLRFLGQRTDEALAMYEQAFKLNPNNPHLYYYSKALLLDDHRRYEEALLAYQQVILLDPNNVDAWARKWDMLIQLGRHDEAQQAYEKTMQLGGHWLIKANNYDISADIDFDYDYDYDENFEDDNPEK